jgi:chromosome partitioning protein
MRIIAIANQKGGCGKTTTAINLAASLVELDQRVLLLDLDSQGHTGLGLGLPADGVENGLYDVLSPLTDQSKSLPEILVTIKPNLDLAPSQILLSALEQELTGREGRERRLREPLVRLADRYDFALLDCPPGIGILNFNALYAADEVLIPVDSSIYSLHGIGKFLETIELAEHSFGKHYRLHVLMTRQEGRTRLSRAMRMELEEFLPGLLMEASVRQNVRIADAAVAGRCLADFDRQAPALEDFMECARELMARGVGEPPVLRPRLDLEAAAPVRRPPRLQPVHFTLRRPGATRVQIACEANNWRPQSMRLEPGEETWHAEMALAPGQYRYKFIVDGEWITDPENEATAPNPYGGCDSIITISRPEAAEPIPDRTAKSVAAEDMEATCPKTSPTSGG